MCGRYAITFDHDAYLGGVPVHQAIYSYNVAPSHTVPILVDHLLENPESLENQATQGYSRKIHSARWGLIPSWAKEASFSAKTFNARSESIFDKPSFSQAAVSGHCAIPISGYYEWKEQERGSSKQAPYYVWREDQQPIYLAGLYSWWKVTPQEANKPGSPHADQAGQWLLTCAIVTTEAPAVEDIARLAEAGLSTVAAQELASLHHRIPLPLSYGDKGQDGVGRWLKSGMVAGEKGRKSLATATLEAREALAELQEDAYNQTSAWKLRQVSKDVGNIGNNAPYLLEPDQDLLSGLNF